MSSVPNSVAEAVEERLVAVEREYDVHIALAVARGSHAWGAAGPNSDYDVGAVFVPADLRTYAHLEGPVEVVHEDGGSIVDSGGDDGGPEIELQGWDVHTFARLLADSNDGAIDLLRSPIRYRTAFDPDALRAYLEATYNPMDLYHAWRGIATSNYRKYVSHHLVDGDSRLYPILEVREEAYVVETPDSAGPTTVAADDERYTETQTKPTVKRNLTIIRAAMAARYLKATGERGDHDLPALAFARFLTEQAPAVFDDDRIERARELLERKRRGEGAVDVGDAVGREFAHPPREIDPAVHARGGPDPTRLDDFVDELIAAAQ